MTRIFCCLVAVGCVVLCSGFSAAQEDGPKPGDAPKAGAPAEATTPGTTTPEKTSPAADPGDPHDDHKGPAFDPTKFDNSSLNASSGLAKVEEFRFDQALATFIVFMLLAAILAKFAWGPISDGLDKREANIARMIDDARLAQEQAEAQLRSYESKLAAATEEARVTVAQARADAEAAKDRIQNEAKELAARERAKAVDDINAAKNAALQQIAEKSVTTAISLASSIVKREVKPEDHDRLVTEALGQFSKLN